MCMKKKLLNFKSHSNVSQIFCSYLQLHAAAIQKALERREELAGYFSDD